MNLPHSHSKQNLPALMKPQLKSVNSIFLVPQIVKQKKKCPSVGASSMNINLSSNRSIDSSHSGTSLTAVNGGKGIKESFSVHRFSQRLNGISNNNKSTQLKKIGSSFDVTSLGNMMSFEGIIITIKIRSNWGDPQKVVLPSIQIMDNKRARLDIVNINTIPKLSAEDDNQIMTLCNDNLLKESDDIITVEWPLKDEKFDTFSIIVFANSKYVNLSPKHMRIWNQKGSGDASIKEISVLEGDRLVFGGEVPREFGVNFDMNYDIPSSSSSATNSPSYQSSFGRTINSYNSAHVLTTLFPNLAKSKGVQDTYGKYPLREIQTIRFEILSTFINENFVGLNGIDLYDENQQLITYDQMEDISLEGFSTFRDPTVLFRPNKHSIDWNDMLLLETDWELTPAIQVEFKKVVIVTEIVIWNFNAEKRNLKYGVKKLKIRADNKLWWCGKIQMGTGTKNGIVQCTTPIWLVDIKKIREKELYE